MWQSWVRACKIRPMTLHIFKESDRTGPLSDRLRNLGYRLEECRIGGRLLIRMTAPSGRTWLTGKNMAYPMNSRMVYEVADNKRLSYDMALAAGIEVPESLYTKGGQDYVDDAREMLKRHDRLIVKPLDSYKSRGVTLGISTVESLDEAIRAALGESSVAIVQEQVRGEEYRFTVLDGSVVSVLRRERPQVVGDGSSAICDLVEAENAMRRAMPGDGVVTYPQWTQALLGDVVNSEEVLADGEVQLLSNTSLVSRGASVYELIDQVDRSYIEMAERFVNQIGAGFVAIDMFIINHTEAAKAGRYWFNECNASPSLKMYFASRNRSSVHVVDEVIQLTDRHLIK